MTPNFIHFCEKIDIENVAKNFASVSGNLWKTLIYFELDSSTFVSPGKKSKNVTQKILLFESQFEKNLKVKLKNKSSKKQISNMRTLGPSELEDYTFKMHS